MIIQARLAEIQQKLSVPKSQRNSFGNYNYRSCEDILEAVKPLLGDMMLTISDEMVCMGDRYYIKATAQVSLADEWVKVTGYAREPQTKKGMDESQITGATSSYARKYALNGLFAIDDTKDADTQDNSKEGQDKQSSDLPWLEEAQYNAMVKFIGEGKGSEVKAKMGKYRMKKAYKDELNKLLANNG